MTLEIDSSTILSSSTMARDERRELVVDLTYNAYRWQRSYYGIAAERLAPHFPLADKYEARYQEELASTSRTASAA